MQPRAASTSNTSAGCRGEHTCVERAEHRSIEQEPAGTGDGRAFTLNVLSHLVTDCFLQSSSQILTGNYILLFPFLTPTSVHPF